MSGLTAVIAEARLTEYLAAETKVLSGQSYTIGGRQLTRANLSEIREGIDYWNTKAIELGSSRTGIIVRGFESSHVR